MTFNPEMYFTKLTETAILPTPTLRDEDSGFEVGIDLYVDSVEMISESLVKIKSGIAQSKSPRDHWLMLAPRSSAYKSGLILVNSVGIIDPSYRGDISAVFFIYDKDLFKSKVIEKGNRFVQLIPILKAETMGFAEEKEIAPSLRGDLGFGSSGC